MIPTGNQFFIVTDENLNVTELSPHLNFLTGKLSNQECSLDHIFIKSSFFSHHISPVKLAGAKCIYFTSAQLKLSDGSTMPTYWHITPVNMPGGDKVTHFIWNGFNIPEPRLYSGLNGGIHVNLRPYTLTCYLHQPEFRKRQNS